MNVMKLLLALIMMFALGTSTVNAEKNTASIEDRIDELAKIESDSQSAIKTKVDELSEDELKTVIANVNELTPPSEEDLAIKEATINKLAEMESVEKSNLLAIGIHVLGVILVYSVIVLCIYYVDVHGIQWWNYSVTYAWNVINFYRVGIIDKMMSSKLTKHKSRRMNMIKLLLASIMMFAFGTSTVNAEKNTTRIEDRISELADTKSDNQSIINAKVDELSEDELKSVITNVNELTEPNEEDLAIKEAAISKLEEMENVEELSPLAIGIGFLALVLLLYTFIIGQRP